MTIETPSSTSSPSPSPAASSTPAAEAAEDASSDAASSSSASPSPPTPAEGHDEEEEDSPMDNGVQEENEDALRRRLERPEDFEDSETRRRPFREAEEALKAMKRKRKEAEDSPPAKRGRGRPPGSAKKSKDLDRDGALNGRLNGAVPPSVVDRNEELSVALAECLSSGRPERRCKTTTNTLVALSIADEALDLNFEDAFVTAASSKRAEDAGEDDDKPLKRPRKKKRKTSSSSSTCSSSASSSKSSAAAKATAAASTSPPPPPEPSGASRPQAEKKQEEGGSNEEETLARELNGKEESSSNTASASESPAQLGGKVPAAREDDASNFCQSKGKEEEGRSKAEENVPKPREEAGESPTAEAVPDTPATPRRKRGRPRLSERLTVNQPPPSQPAKTETEEASFEAPEANGRVLEDVEEKPQQTEGDVQAAAEVHPAAVASKSKKAQKKFPPKGKKKRRRKKFMLSPKKKKYPGKASKKQGERQQQEEDKKAVAAEPKVERRGRPRKVVVATAADSKEISLEDSASNAKCNKAPPAVAEKRPSVLPAPLEELLPDLSPPKPQRRSGKKAPTKRAVSEKERAAQIVEEVTTAERAFSCLGCGGFFSHYGLLLRHKRSDCSGSKASTAAKHVFISGAVQNGASDPESPFRQPCPPEYSRLVSSALRRVPETTFNWMNGKLEHLSTLDGRRMIRLGGPGAVSAVNKVKLNYSGQWTTEDVWETGGWELSR